MVTHDRAEWAASGHIHRVRPKPGINAGLVYLACSCAPIQSQFKSLAGGSLVDALSDVDVASVFVPYEDSTAAAQLGDAAQEAWHLFEGASAAEKVAIDILEAEYRGKPVPEKLEVASIA